MRAIGWLLAVSLLLRAASSVAAQSPLPAQGSRCHAYADVARQLSAIYHESPVSLGIQSNGDLLLVFNSPTSGSWTIVSTTPTGLTCILAAGRHWETAAPALLGSPV